LTGEPHYASPVALRHAITDRLRRLAAEKPGRSLQDLLRQFAYDRLLFRVFSSEDSDRWVLKGATALLARLGGDARHTVDIDLYDRSGTLDDAEQALRAAAARDVGDQFRFVLTPGRRIAEGGVAVRVNVTALLGASEFARFNVDLVAGVGMSGSPDEAEPLIPIEVPGIPRTRYRIYPLADHIADKVLAMVERHARQGGEPVASTRYRDLADLVVVARREVVDAAALGTALREQAGRRRFELPNELRPPDDAGWRSGYARVARDVPGLEEKDIESAVATVSRFIDPVLQGRADGQWDPTAMAWRRT
jgi:hypothetical protein